MKKDPDPGGPKTYGSYGSGSGFGSGSATQENTNISLFRANLESKLVCGTYHTKKKNVKICQDPAFTKNLKKSKLAFTVSPYLHRLLLDMVPKKKRRAKQCWGSVTFWCGSGSPDPYLWLMDPDPDPASFFNDFKEVKK
jgi:hypothetical protein